MKHSKRIRDGGPLLEQNYIDSYHQADKSGFRQWKGVCLAGNKENQLQTKKKELGCELVNGKQQLLQYREVKEKEFRLDIWIYSGWIMRGG